MKSIIISNYFNTPVASRGKVLKASFKFLEMSLGGLLSATTHAEPAVPYLITSIIPLAADSTLKITNVYYIPDYRYIIANTHNDIFRLLALF